MMTSLAEIVHAKLKDLHAHVCVFTGSNLTDSVAGYVEKYEVEDFNCGLQSFSNIDCLPRSARMRNKEI